MTQPNSVEVESADQGSLPSPKPIFATCTEPVLGMLLGTDFITQKVKVIQVIPGTQLHKQGVQMGHFVAGVNGMSTVDMSADEVRNTVLKASRPVTITFAMSAEEAEICAKPPSMLRGGGSSATLRALTTPMSTSPPSEAPTSTESFAQRSRPSLVEQPDIRHSFREASTYEPSAQRGSQGKWRHGHEGHAGHAGHGERPQPVEEDRLTELERNATNPTMLTSTHQPRHQNLHGPKREQPAFMTNQSFYKPRGPPKSSSNSTI